MGKDILFPQGNTESERLKFLANKYIFNPSDVEMQKAQTAKTPLESIGHSVAGAIPLVGPWAASLGEQAGTGDIGGAVARGGAQVATGAGAAKVLGKVGGATEGESSPASIGARERLITKLQNTGSTVTGHVGQVADRFKAVSDANAQAVSSAVEQKFPQGHPALNKEAIAEPIREKLGALVQGGENLPPSLNKLIASPLEEASVFQGAGLAGRGGMNASDMLRNPNIAPEVRAQIEAASPKPSTTGGGETWGWEELKQIKSDLGREVFGRNTGHYAPQAEAIGKIAYHDLDKPLGQAAQDSGVAKEFATYKQMHRQYMDDFVRGPLGKVLSADNPTDVANTIQGKRSQVVRDALDRYKDYGMNKGEVLNRAKSIESGVPYTKPIRLSAWDYRLLGSSALGGIHPAGYAIGPVIEGIRLGVPLAERVIRAGLTSKVKPIKVK